MLLFHFIKCICNRHQFDFCSFIVVAHRFMSVRLSMAQRSQQRHIWAYGRAETRVQRFMYRSEAARRR